MCVCECVFLLRDHTDGRCRNTLQFVHMGRMWCGKMTTGARRAFSLAGFSLLNQTFQRDKSESFNDLSSAVIQKKKSKYK